MKRLSVNKATILFASVLTTIVALFMFTLHLHNKQQAAEQQVFDTMWDDMVDNTGIYPSYGILCDTSMSMAGVSVQDSCIFEYLAESVTVMDWPEEMPEVGDSVCAYISHDTMYVQHWNKNKCGNQHQRNRFRWIYGQ